MLEAGIEFHNSFCVQTVVMDEPTLDDTMPDNERLARAVCAVGGYERAHLTFEVLLKLPDVLRDHGFKVKCVVNEEAGEAVIYDVVGAEESCGAYGLAIDIGTTTVSALIADMMTGEIVAKASSGNGQIRFGADVINRILESQKPGQRW